MANSVTVLDFYPTLSSAGVIQLRATMKQLLSLVLKRTL